jgi:hypothetical protein
MKQKEVEEAKRHAVSKVVLKSKFDRIFNACDRANDKTVK